MMGPGAGITAKFGRAANDNRTIDESQTQSVNDNEAVPENPDEASNVTPEEQAAYERFVDNGLNVIYPEGEQAAVSEAVLRHLAGEFEPQAQQMFAAVEPPLAGSPIDNVAGSGVLLTLMLEGSAEQAGKPIADEIVLHGGMALIEELVEVGEAAKLFELDEEQVEFAALRAVDIYRVVSPRVNPETLAQEFGQVVEADRAGGLDQLLPGISQRMAA